MTALIQLHDLPWLWYVIAIIFGLIVGSFFNVVIHRMPLMLHRLWHQEANHYLDENPHPPKLSKVYNLLLPPSHCPACQSNVKRWQNIPVISYLLLRGRCACGQSIAKRYFVVEMLTALIAVIVTYHYGWTWKIWPALIFSGYLIVLGVIDFEQQLLLDELTIGLLWLGLIFNYFGFYTDLSTAMFGAIFGYLSLWVVAKLFYLLTKRDGMAYGDFKLFAAIGAWLGWQSLLWVLLSASVLGIFVTATLHCLKRANLRHPIPFGPYLAIAAWLYLLFAQPWLTTVSMAEAWL